MEFSLTYPASSADQNIIYPDQVDAELSIISPSLSQSIFADAAKEAIERNEKADTDIAYSKKETSIQFQQHFSAAIYSQLLSKNWTIQELKGAKVALSPNNVLLNILTGSNIGSNSNIKAKKGIVMTLAVNDSQLGDMFNIKTWILLFSRKNNIIKLEMVQPKSVENGKVTEFLKRILLNEINVDEFDVPVKALEKTKVFDVEPIRRKKTK